MKNTFLTMHQANNSIIFRKFCHWRIHLHHLPKIISLTHFGLSSNSGPRSLGHSMFGMSNFGTKLWSSASCKMIASAEVNDLCRSWRNFSKFLPKFVYPELAVSVISSKSELHGQEFLWLFLVCPSLGPVLNQYLIFIISFWFITLSQIVDILRFKSFPKLKNGNYMCRLS